MNNINPPRLSTTNQSIRKQSSRRGKTSHASGAGKALPPLPLNDPIPYPATYDRETTDCDNLDSKFLYELQKGISLHDFGDKHPRKSLDLGCGRGAGIITAAKRWPRCHFVGFDIVNIQPDTRLLPPKLGSRITWVQGNFLHPLPFEDDSFDHVRACRIAMGIPEDKWSFVLEEVTRVLRPGGVLEMMEENLIFPTGRPPRSAVASGSGALASRSDQRLPAVPVRPLFARRESGASSTPSLHSPPQTPFPSDPPPRRSFHLPSTPSPDASKGDIDQFDTFAPQASKSSGIDSANSTYSTWSSSQHPPATSATSAQSSRFTLDSKRGWNARRGRGQSDASSTQMSNQMTLLNSRPHTSTGVTSTAGFKLAGLRPTEARRTRGPPHPRDHTILKLTFDAMLSERFINPNPLSILPYYLSLHLKHVVSSTPIQFELPKPSPDTRIEDKDPIPPTQPPPPLPAVPALPSLPPSAFTFSSPTVPAEPVAAKPAPRTPGRTRSTSTSSKTPEKSDEGRKGKAARLIGGAHLLSSSKNSTTSSSSASSSPFGNPASMGLPGKEGQPLQKAPRFPPSSPVKEGFDKIGSIRMDMWRAPLPSGRSKTGRSRPTTGTDASDQEGPVIADYQAHSAKWTKASSPRNSVPSAEFKSMMAAQLPDDSAFARLLEASDAGPLDLQSADLPSLQLVRAFATMNSCKAELRRQFFKLEEKVIVDSLPHWVDAFEDDAGGIHEASRSEEEEAAAGDESDEDIGDEVEDTYGEDLTTMSKDDQFEYLWRNFVMDMHDRANLRDEISRRLGWTAGPDTSSDKQKRVWRKHVAKADYVLELAEGPRPPKRVGMRPRAGSTVSGGGVSFESNSGESERRSPELCRVVRGFVGVKPGEYVDPDHDLTDDEMQFATRHTDDEDIDDIDDDDDDEDF